MCSPRRQAGRAGKTQSRKRSEAPRPKGQGFGFMYQFFKESSIRKFLILSKIFPIKSLRVSEHAATLIDRKQNGKNILCV